MAGRIRSIKPELLEDELASGLKDAAWRLYVSSWLLADDHGRFRAGLKALASNVWQDTTKEGHAEKALNELTAKGFLRLYEVEGQRYAEIKPRAWRAHQRIDHPGKPRVPAPCEYDNLDAVSRPLSENIRDSRELSDSLGPRAHAGDLRPPTSDLRPTNTDRGSLAADAASVLGSPFVPTLVPLDPPRDQPREVWDHYVAGWHSKIRGTREPKLTDGRRRLAKTRLGEFSSDDLKLAIDGMLSSDWHLENGHISFELALRDAKHIEQFIALAGHGRTSGHRAAAAPAESLIDRMNREERQRRMGGL